MNLRAWRPIQVCGGRTRQTPQQKRAIQKPRIRFLEPIQLCRYYFKASASCVCREAYGIAQLRITVFRDLSDDKRWSVSVSAVLLDSNFRKFQLCFLRLGNSASFLGLGLINSLVAYRASENISGDSLRRIHSFADLDIGTGFDLRNEYFHRA